MSNSTLPPPSDAVMKFIAAGNKIEAIKAYRMQTGVGLAVSKDKVEQYFGDANQNTYQQSPDSTLPPPSVAVETLIAQGE